MNKEYLNKIIIRYNISPENVELYYDFSRRYGLHIYDIKILFNKYKKEKYVVQNVKSMKFENKLERWLNDEYKIYDTDRFRQSAINFTKNHKYTNAIKNSHPSSNYMRFWFEEARRSIYGYLDGDEWITGYNYFYLNYTPIELTILLDDNSNIEDETNVQGERVVGFPKFWDGNFFFNHYLEEAERHGLSASVLKTRGRGYSWGGASMLNRNFFLIPRSRSIIYASDDEYLTGGDGVLTKCWSQMSFIDENTAWTKKKQKKDTDHHKRASMVKTINGTEIEQGFLSEIIGKTLQRSASSARGKRAKLILYEEGGSFKNLVESWIVAKPSVAQGKIVYGLRCVYGTGGEEGAGFEGLRKMFYQPKIYSIYSVSNFWTPGNENTKVGWFQPEYINREGYYDEDGNSNISKAKNDILQEREDLMSSGADIDVVLRTKAEQPIFPEEAVLRTSGSPFPRTLLKEQVIFLNTNQDFLGEISRGKIVFNSDNKAIWKEDNNVKVIESHNPSKINREGGIEIYQHPIDAIKEYNYGYIIGVDPIDFDYNEISGSKYSLGSCFVMNTITKRIVAEYTGRPEMVDTFYETVRRLGLYYNAKIMYENNIKGLYTYFVNRYSEYMLALKPKILDDSDNLIVTGRRKYGYTTNERTNKLGLQLIKKWLSEPIDEEGNLIIINTIKSKGLLDELIEWNPTGNFDRVSAMIVLMIFFKDIERMLDSGIDDTNKSEENKFWSRPFKYTK